MSDALVDISEGPVVPIHALRKAALDPFLARRPARSRAQAELVEFKAKAGQVCVLTRADGRIERALLGLGDGGIL